MIADAGPLIVFHKTGQLHILKALYKEILIPEAVRRELASRPEGEKLLGDSPWIKTKEVRGRDALSVLLVFLDHGEAEALALAKESGEALLIDERRGRKIAAEMGIRIRGTLGALVEAKRKGIVKNVGEQIRKMIAKGYYMDAELVDIVLRKVGEKE